ATQSSGFFVPENPHPYRTLRKKKVLAITMHAPITNQLSRDAFCIGGHLLSKQQYDKKINWVQPIIFFSPDRVGHTHRIK
ncbi:hypothetical protein, partial [Magnetococcus sp. PR-3]|uniref:hypothetical protein n=1 Tax=Magnetococcus sp. PR-3 TaxID=3120355 RepID=UPI002FCE34D1